MYKYKIFDIIICEVDIMCGFVGFIDKKKNKKKRVKHKEKREYERKTQKNKKKFWLHIEKENHNI